MPGITSRFMVADAQKYTKVLDRLRRLCSRREYCMSDIFRKAVEAMDGDRESAESILDVLRKEKYVDDLRYASAFVRDKSAIAGWGEVKIRYMLSAKGVAKDIIAQALAEIDSDRAGRRLEKLLENKWNSLKDDPQGKLKLIRFALGRGYGYEETVSLIDRICKG